jgi:predicted N-acetyltransferase YhbS
MAGALSFRPFRDETDWWRVRELLIEIRPLVPRGSVWDIRRWDGRRFHCEDPWAADVLERCGLWEGEDGILVAAAHSEGARPDVHLQVRPEHRDLEGDMLDWAIENLAGTDRGVVRLHHMAWDDDDHRIALLRQRGFVRLEEREVTRWLSLRDAVLPAPDVPAGYALRHTGDDPADHAHMAELLNAAFRRTMHSAEEYRVFSTQSPSFRHDLSLVVEAPNGGFAAHVGFTIDEENGWGLIEPVCTHPEHRRRGLAVVLIREGLRRLQSLGIERAEVGTGGEEGPNRFYEAAGFVGPRWGHVWRWQQHHP